jgi:FecR protein/Putative zinc-finger
MTMFTRHISGRLAAYIDGELAQGQARRAELHMEHCVRCQRECEQVRFGMAMVEHLGSVEAPDAIWTSIEAALPQSGLRQNSTVPRWRWSFAAAAVVLGLASVVYWRVAHRLEPRWEVVSIEGSPSVGAKPIRGAGQIGAGEWIETDAGSRATVKIGKIGSVEIAPNTRVRVVVELPQEHRLTLTRGEIRAKISAPPKLFLVDTRSGTAVDLGCEYRLRADENGFGLLQVSKGWVSFQWKGQESLVPAGASCRMRPQVGPGIPYFDDAPETFVRALETFGFEKDGTDDLRIILSEARVRDTLSLWHLLSRVDASDRARVYDRIAALTPVPAGVSREQALRLDPETLKRWKDELAWTW